jgi:hypothetical protein
MIILLKAFSFQRHKQRDIESWKYIEEDIVLIKLWNFYAFISLISIFFMILNLTKWLESWHNGLMIQNMFMN